MSACSSRLLLLASLLGLLSFPRLEATDAPAAPTSTPVSTSTPAPTPTPASAPAPAPAKPHAAPASSPHTRYLLVGGGSSPYNTQVSLEEHLARVQRLLESRGVPETRRPLLFADGATGAPVVEVYDREAPRDPLDNELALLFDRQDNRGSTWRPPQLTGVDGPATRSRLKDELEAHAGTTRTLLYFAGHGHQDKEENVTLGLWDQERLTPAQLSRWLDALPRTHRFVAVLSQCHSGGFGALLYPNGDPDKEPVRADRCAFFAAPTDQPSSGCTAEANRPDPDDYSTWFFSALSGSLPGGRPLPSTADIDADGRVTLTEAHAFARIHDGTIDVPVSSSEYYLRIETYDLPMPEGLTLASPFPALLEQARPAERQVLESLAKSLGLEGDPAAGLKARYEANRLDDERNRLREEEDSIDQRIDEARNTLRKALLNRWPWLGNPYHPRAREVITKERAAIQAFLSARPERAAIDKLNRETRPLRSRIDQLDRQWARWERLARAAEAVVMERWLRQKGAAARIEKLDAILRCEADTL